MAYIDLPNVAWQRLLEAGLDDLWTPQADLFPASANLCAMPTYVPCQKAARDNFESPFP